MGKPIDLFRGKAPQAMTLMGQGVADAYARAGEITGASYAKFGEQIGGAIQSVASMYADSKAIKGKVNANLKALEANPELFGMQAGDAAKHKANMSDMSTTEKYDYLSTVMSNSMMDKQQQYKLDQIGTQIRGELTNTTLSNSLKSSTAPTLDSGITGGSNSNSLLQGVPNESRSSQSGLPLPSGNTGGSVQLLRPDAQSLLDQALKSFGSPATKKPSFLKSFYP